MLNFAGEDEARGRKYTEFYPLLYRLRGQSVTFDTHMLKSIRDRRGTVKHTPPRGLRGRYEIERGTDAGGTRTPHHSTSTQHLTSCAARAAASTCGARLPPAPLASWIKTERKEDQRMASKGPTSCPLHMLSFSPRTLPPPHHLCTPPPLQQRPTLAASEQGLDSLARINGR